MIEVFLDLDGVLVDLVGGLCRYHKIQNPYIHSANLGKYNLREIVGMSSEEFWGRLDHDFWLDLEWMYDGRSILETILNWTDRITILTAPTGFKWCAEGKIAWLKKHLPKFRYLIGQGKEAIAAPDKFLIDDYDKNIDLWRINGGYAIQIPRPWNRLHGQERLCT